MTGIFKYNYQLKMSRQVSGEAGHGRALNEMHPIKEHSSMHEDSDLAADLGTRNADIVTGLP